jgi:hypothetical protein
MAGRDEDSYLKTVISDLLMKPCQKKQESLNRRDAKYAKLKTRSRGIVQNRDTVLDKAAFSFAVTRQMKKILPSLATLVP